MIITFVFRAVVQLSSPGSVPSPSLRWRWWFWLSGPWEHLPILEVLNLLLRDDSKLWILSLWWSLPTGNLYFNSRFFWQLYDSGINPRCRWVRTFWPMAALRTASTSSPPMEKNLGLTTHMNSGLRIEKSEIYIYSFWQLLVFNLCTNRSSKNKVGIEW